MSKNYKQAKVNLLPDEHKKIKKMADENGLTISTFIRLKLEIDSELNNIKPKNMKKVPCQKVPHSLLYHLSKIGTNLNQIAEHCNIKRAIDQHALNELRSLRAKIWTLE